MKWFALIALASTSVMAQSSQDCLKVKNNLDRRYCFDKYLENVKEKQTTERKAWGAGLPQTTKDEKAAALEAEIQAKREWANAINSEVAIHEKQLADLKAVPVAQAAAPAPEPEKKKKKKKGLFGIKL